MKKENKENKLKIEKHRISSFNAADMNSVKGGSTGISSAFCHGVESAINGLTYNYHPNYPNSLFRQPV